MLVTDSKFRIMLVGSFASAALERSYAAAFQDLGCTVLTFDIIRLISNYCRGGRLGRLFNKFVPVETWSRKANREMVLEADKFKPHVFVVVGQNPVQVGALAQIRAMSDLRAVFIWPDTLVNLNHNVVVSLPLYDLIATYSCSTVPLFERLGAKRTEWIPLGADPHMHLLPDTASQLEYDVSFIGQWRPEREEAISAIMAGLPGMSIKIWGSDWKRRSSNSIIINAWQGRPLYEKEFAQVVASSKINLNIIDDTNYPAANMRFFEIPCACGVQVCSPCPEMETTFRHGETIFYYSKLDELPGLIFSLLNNEPLRQKVARQAHELVIGEHTYRHRAHKILGLLGTCNKVS